MYFKYGTYQHPDNEVNLTNLMQRRVYSDRHRLLYTEHTLTVMGEINGTSQADLRTKIAALIDAYADDGERASLFHDDDTESAHFLSSSNSINGVQVIDLSFPSGQPGEYTNCRTYQITLRAEYDNIEGTSDIVSFQESLRWIGTGGPMWEAYPVLVGPPVARVLFTATPQKVHQTGFAVGYRGWPLVPSPLFPQWEHLDRRIVQPDSPKSYRNARRFYPIRWAFDMTTPGGLSGYPNIGP